MNKLKQTCFVPISLALFSCNEGNYDMGLIESQTIDSAVSETSRVTTDEVSQVAISFFRKYGCNLNN